MRSGLVSDWGLWRRPTRVRVELEMLPAVWRENDRERIDVTVEINASLSICFTCIDKINTNIFC